MSHRKSYEEEEDSMPFEAPEFIVPVERSLDDSEITFDRSDNFDLDSSEFDSDGSDDDYAEFRKQAARIRTREPFNSPTKNRVKMVAPSRFSISRPLDSINPFRQHNQHKNGSTQNGHREVPKSRDNTTTGAQGDEMNEFQRLASGQLPSGEEIAPRRAARRSRSIDETMMAPPPPSLLFSTSSHSHEAFRGGSSGEPRAPRRGVRRHKSSEGAAMLAPPNPSALLTSASIHSHQSFEEEQSFGEEPAPRRGVRRHNSSDDIRFNPPPPRSMGREEIRLDHPLPGAHLSVSTHLREPHQGMLGEDPRNPRRRVQRSMSSDGAMFYPPSAMLSSTSAHTYDGFRAPPPTTALSSASTHSHDAYRGGQYPEMRAPRRGVRPSRNLEGTQQPFHSHPYPTRDGQVSKHERDIQDFQAMASGDGAPSRRGVRRHKSADRF